MCKNILLTASITFCWLANAFGAINFSSTESTIGLNAGSSLILGSDISGWSGTLEKKAGSTISGSSIYFDSGIYSDGIQDIKFSGTYNQDGSLALANSAIMNINQKTDLTSALTFNGACTLIGNGNILNLSTNGRIVVERGSSLVLKDIILKGIGSDNFFCRDNSGTFSFQNVTWYQSEDFTFSNGHFDVISTFNVKGGHKFNFTTTNPSTIQSDAVMFLDSDVTFSYDPRTINKDLIVFESQSSTLQLNGATLHVTLTGMNLALGNLVVSKNSYIETEVLNSVDEGVTFGDDLGNDFACQILGNSKLEISTGSIKYKNVSNNSFYAESPQSTILMNGGCNLYLYQTLNLGVGQITFIGGTIYHSSGAQIIGSVNALGQINNIEI